MSPKMHFKKYINFLRLFLGRRSELSVSRHDFGRAALQFVERYDEEQTKIRGQRLK